VAAILATWKKPVNLEYMYGFTLKSEARCAGIFGLMTRRGSRLRKGYPVDRGAGSSGWRADGNFPFPVGEPWNRATISLVVLHFRV